MVDPYETLTDSPRCPKCHRRTLGSCDECLDCREARIREEGRQDGLATCAAATVDPLLHSDRYPPTPAYLRDTERLREYVCALAAAHEPPLPDPIARADWARSLWTLAECLLAEEHARRGRDE